MSRQRVCAVVVTYDRRDLLVECLDALLRQTHRVATLYVIDNASTDGTADHLRDLGYLDRPDLRYLRLERNGGSAGGFAAGIAAARVADADWLWIVDDDAEPVTDALELLLASPAAADPGVAALCPAVLRPDGSLDIGHRGLFRRKPRALPAAAYGGSGPPPELDYFTFVGPLLRMSAARAADPPRAELLIWADDYEYSFRVREQGRLLLVPESRIVHNEVAQSHSTRRSRFLNRLTGWDLDPTPLESFWRNIHGARNFIWIKRRYEGQGPVSAWGTTAQFLLKALLYDDRPLRRMRWLVRYARAGRRGEFVNIPPDQWRAMVERGEV